MKKIVLLVLLLLSTLCWAQLNQDQYSINVHVSSSRWFNAPEGESSRALQRLSVTIGGKKYELEYFSRRTTIDGAAAVLALGDYKAKLVKDEHLTAYESTQIYEFLFPDKKTRKFIVVGETE
jgi:hypothetical protein